MSDGNGKSLCVRNARTLRRLGYLALFVTVAMGVAITQHEIQLDRMERAQHEVLAHMDPKQTGSFRRDVRECMSLLAIRQRLIMEALSIQGQDSEVEIRCESFD